MKALLPLTDTDERAVSLENAGFRWAFNVLSTGVLLDILWRSLQHQVPYDLWALVLIAGCIPFGYAVYYRTLRPDWWKRLGILWGVIVALQVLTMPFLIRYLMAGD